MKKNPVKRALLQRGDPETRHAVAMRIPARIFCLFLALIIWLAVVNLNKLSEGSDGEETNSDPATEETAS